MTLWILNYWGNRETLSLATKYYKFLLSKLQIFLSINYESTNRTSYFE